MDPKNEDVQWLMGLATQEEPPAVRLSDLKRRGLISGDREELACLVAAGCDFQRDVRDGSIWINADNFVRGCNRVYAQMGPRVVH